MNEPKVIDILTFAGEGPVPCVRKTDYDNVAERLAKAERLLRRVWPEALWSTTREIDDFLAGASDRETVGNE